MAAGSGNFSLHTEGHSHHSAVWTMAGVSMPTICLACAMDMLENRKKELTVRVMMILKELTLSTSRHEKQTQLMRMMASDWRITSHVCNVVIGLLSDDHESIVQESLKTNIMQLHPKREVYQMIMLKSIQQAQKFCKYSPSVIGYLAVIGNILHKDSSLIMDVNNDKENFVQYVVDGLTCDDESVKSSLVYILVQICSFKGKLLQIDIMEKICSHLSVSLATASSHDLTLNLMGLAKTLISSPSSLPCLLQADQPALGSKGSTFASALKRVLLSGDEVIQLLGVQCIASVISQYPQYVQSLLSVDIAEYLFEALSSDSITLLKSIVSCLNLISLQDKFYTGCHVIYGYQSIIKVLNKTLQMRDEEAVKSCLTLLSSIFKRQPLNIPLVSTEEDITHFLSVLHSAIHFNYLSSVDLLINFLRPCYTVSLPSLSVIVPHLALLLQYIDKSFQESISNCHTTTELHESSNEQLFAVLLAFSKFSRLLQSQASDTNMEEVYEFILCACQETLVPVTLATCTDIEHNTASLQELFTILAILIHQRSAPEFIKLLTRSGFIELAMELRVLSVTEASSLKEESASFIEEAVYVLIKLQGGFHTTEAEGMKAMLRSSLLHIKCSLSDSLNCLVHKAKSTEEASVQASVLCLTYLSQIHADVGPVSNRFLQSVLSQYLSFNSDIHLLSVTTLKILLALYSITKVASGCSNFNLTGSDDVIVNGLLHVSSVTALFTNHNSLLIWAYFQAHLKQQSITKEWLQEWLVLSSDYEILVNSVVDHVSTLMDDCLAIIASGRKESLKGATNLLVKLLSMNQLQESLNLKKLEMFFLMQMPLNESRLTAVLKAVNYVSIKDNIKLFYQSMCYSCFREVREFCCICKKCCSSNLGDSPEIFVHILQVVLNVISTGSFNFQATSIVLSSTSLLNKLLDVFHKRTLVQPVPLSMTILVLAKLIENLSEGLYKQISNEDIIPLKLSCAMLLEHLFDDQFTVVNHAINLWTAILSTEKQSIVLIQDYPTGGTVHAFQVLVFMLINLMADDSEELNVACVKCFQALFHHACCADVSFERIICNDWLKMLFSFLTIKYSENLPLHFKQLQDIITIEK